MNIYFIGGEDHDFPNWGGPWYADGNCRAGFARETVCPNNYMSWPPPQSNTWNGGAQTDFWFGFFSWCDYGYTENLPLVGVTHSDKKSGEGIWVGFVPAASNRIGISTYNGSAWSVLAYDPIASFTANLTKIDVHVENFNSASCLISVYLNTALRFTFSGDARVAGLTSLNRTVIAGGYSASGGFHRYYHSEIVVADSDTRLLNVVTHYPNGAGSLNEFNGAHTDIDEKGRSDLDWIDSDVNDAVFRSALSKLPATNYFPIAMKVSAVATRPSGSSCSKIRLGCYESSSSDVDAGQTVAENEWVTYERYMTAINGGAITPTKLNSMEMEIRTAT
jgi:hypothetical protein